MVTFEEDSDEVRGLAVLVSGGGRARLSKCKGRGVELD